MKYTLTVLMLALLTFSSCQYDKGKTVDLDILQKSLNADPEVSQLRNLLYSYSGMLASITVEQLDAIHTKLHACNLYGSTASASELESCLQGMSSAKTYIEVQKQIKLYEQQYKVVEARFPEFAQLNKSRQAELLVPINEAEAQKALSQYLSNQKK